MSGNPDSLVHNKPTSGRLALAESFQTHLTARNQTAFEKSIDFYRAVDLEHGGHYHIKVMDCRTRAWFARNTETGQVRIMSYACGLRWCYLCSQARRTYISRAVAAWIKAGQYRKFLTLTLKHSDDPLSSQIDRIYNCFQKLKKSKLFRTKVTAGVWFFQVKRSRTSGEWHPHIHCIISGKWLPKGQLSKTWLKITHDSKVADLRMVRDPDKAANEVARYATAPANLETTHPIDYLTIYDALSKRRIAGTWGLKGVVSLSQPKADTPGTWDRVGSWDLVKSQQGDDGAADAIIKAWATDTPLDEGVTLELYNIEKQNGLHNYYLNSPIKYQMDLFTET